MWSEWMLPRYPLHVIIQFSALQPQFINTTIKIDHNIHNFKPTYLTSWMALRASLIRSIYSIFCSSFVKLISIFDPQIFPNLYRLSKWRKSYKRLPWQNYQTEQDPMIMILSTKSGVPIRERIGDSIQALHSASSLYYERYDLKRPQVTK
jgi:hypothetical protein